MDKSDELIKSIAYKYIFVRVNYPRENGYRMEMKTLPSWMYLTITRDSKNNKAEVTVYSKIHVGKVFLMPTSYSAQFTNREILRDISGTICHRFGV